jgi:polyisoprenoid-binding protein YceI
MSGLGPNNREVDRFAQNVELRDRRRRVGLLQLPLLGYLASKQIEFDYRRSFHRQRAFRSARAMSASMIPPPAHEERCHIAVPSPRAVETCAARTTSDNSIRSIDMKATLLAVSALIAFATSSTCVAAPAADVPAGTYTLDKSHASLIFRVNHLGFSNYTARFTRFDAKLEFDPRNPAASRVTATVDAGSLETDFPFPDQLDFNAQLEGKDWLDAADHPQMTFRSKQVVLTSPNTARINCELTLLGVTKPMALEVTYNGGYAGHPMDPHARIGFSARGSLLRSDYGMTAGIPAPGSKMGVSDAVEIIIEVEFSGPPLQGTAVAD